MSAAVQQTLVIPLIGRTIAAQRWPENFGDAHSKRVVAMLDQALVETMTMNDAAAASYGARYATMVEYARRYLRRYPQAAVVDLGCGLDSLYDAIDNGQMRYYNVDFPDVIQRREATLEPRARETNIATDLRDHAFLQQIPTRHGAIFLAAGVMHFLRLPEAKQLIGALARRFARGRLVFDHQCPAWMEKTNTFLASKGMHDSMMHFRLPDPMVIGQWAHEIRHVAINPEWYAALAQPEALPLALQIKQRYNRARLRSYFVVVDFAAGQLRG